MDKDGKKIEFLFNHPRKKAKNGHVTLNNGIHENYTKDYTL